MEFSLSEEAVESSRRLFIFVWCKRGIAITLVNPVHYSTRGMPTFAENTCMFWEHLLFASVEMFISAIKIIVLPPNKQGYLMVRWFISLIIYQPEAEKLGNKKVPNYLKCRQYAIIYQYVSKTFSSIFVSSFWRLFYEFLANFVMN